MKVRQWFVSNSSSSSFIVSYKNFEKISKKTRIDMLNDIDLTEDNRKKALEEIEKNRIVSEIIVPNDIVNDDEFIYFINRNFNLDLELVVNEAGGY